MFHGMSDTQIMDAIYHPELGLSQKLCEFLVGNDAGPPFDGWWIVVVKHEDADVVVWRESGELNANRVELEPGQFTSTIASFLAWVKGLKPGSS